MPASSVDYDVVIAGGGMVGASLALMLSQSVVGGRPLRVLVVEAFPLPDSTRQVIYRPSFDARSTALSYGSRQILQQLAIWPQVAEHVCAIDRIHVSERSAPASTLLRASDYQWPALGYVVENAWLGNVLLQHLRQRKEVNIVCPARIVKVVPGAGSVTMNLRQSDAEQSISSRLLVVADGAQSGLREQLGISAARQDYHQSAVIANVCFQKPHQNVAYERFTDEGPMALLPLADSDCGKPRAALVWTRTPEQAADLCGCSEQAFLASLQRRFGHRLGAFTRVGERGSYPLALIEAEEQVRSHVVVMGNAAHSLHPVAGQGFNLALRDCAALTQRILQHPIEALGALPQLQAYYQSQQLDQLKTVRFSDQLGDFFASSNGLLKGLRQAGLAAMDGLPLLRRSFVEQAAGMQAGAPQMGLLQALLTPTLGEQQHG